MEAAAKEIEEFEAAFELVHNVEEEGIEAKKKARVTWANIIENEERKLKETAVEAMEVPLTEE
jgi:hypothetical protein